ncbi:MAG: phosphotransferase [Kineosporiaceae bacterium]
MAEAGIAYVIKLHPAHEAADVDLEVAALDTLAGTEAAPLVPVVVRTPDGRHRVEVDVAGQRRIARLLTWRPGRVWAESPPASPTRPRALGAAVATVDRALATFDHPRLARELRWNLATATRQRTLLRHVEDADRRALAAAVLDRFADAVAPALADLPVQAVHNDGNDHNVLVDEADGDRVLGLVDFGDLCRAPRICGLAVAVAYVAGGGIRDLLAVVEGYHGVAPLTATELALPPDLVRTRLALSVLMAGWQSAREPDNAYLLVSQEQVWPALRALAAEDDDLVRYRIRAACGLEPIPHAREVRAFLAGADVAPVLHGPLAELPHRVLDWHAGHVPDAPPDGVVGVGRLGHLSPRGAPRRHRRRDGRRRSARRSRRRPTRERRLAAARPRAAGHRARRAAVDPDAGRDPGGRTALRARALGERLTGPEPAAGSAGGCPRRPPASRTPRSSGGAARSCRPP